MAHDYDLFVIGAGSGGVRAARIAALSGARVAVAEEFRAGGTCVIRGCVPKKFMVYASEFRQAFRDAAGFGYSLGDVAYDHKAFVTKLSAEVGRLSGIYARNLHNAGVELINSRAELEGPNAVRLKNDDRVVTAARILIATGGVPVLPGDIKGVEHCITSNEIFDIETLPRSIVIGGGGYIAVEFAHIFSGLGVETHLVYRGETVLRGFDDDVRTTVHEGLTAGGVNVVTGAVFSEIRKLDDGDRHYAVDLSNGHCIEADIVLGAFGRAPYTSGLGCEKAGVELGPNGEIKVDAWSRTSAPSIWAVGDVTDRVALTPVAIREGHAFADTEFNNNPWKMDHENIATAVFSQPPVGTVGLSEEDARKKYGKVDIYKSQFKPMKGALSGDSRRVLMKLIVREADQVVLGCHIVGPDAPEIIQIVGVAVKMGATKRDFDQTCALHPSLAEELLTMREKYVPTELQAAE